MSDVSPRPHQLVKFVSASNVSEAAPVSESRYVRACKCQKRVVSVAGLIVNAKRSTLAPRA